MVLKRFETAACTVGMLAAAVLGLSTTPAAASGDYSGRAYVHTASGWDDEGLLSTGRHASSNATCLWQKILWADGFLENSDIDGVFGPKTREATVRWQRWRGAGADGVVGPTTFSMAAAWGLWWDGSRTRYTGSSHEISITVDDSGRYGFYDDGVHRKAGYDYRTCS
ncbi:hypothetical protein GCM10010420_55290 [Streptomyces glaucosporus]|uniref:Peptidoglycan binding-like domain-containing protein n=1 Tax=Streptomyces glaucosporus TaxID=284044 RepID=A0ABN3J0U2_9ACTN